MEEGLHRCDRCAQEGGDRLHGDTPGLFRIPGGTGRGYHRAQEAGLRPPTARACADPHPDQEQAVPPQGCKVCPDCLPTADSALSRGDARSAALHLCSRGVLLRVPVWWCCRHAAQAQGPVQQPEGNAHGRRAQRESRVRDDRPAARGQHREREPRDRQEGGRARPDAAAAGAEGGRPGGDHCRARRGLQVPRRDNGALRQEDR
mmetsp:Transcript_70132/g.159177  ORF Transcript_70132/g.159177 Transcript_70132/m.159177 type:complete len:204 (-) Transcript_70132:294-905(-)